MAKTPERQVKEIVLEALKYVDAYAYSVVETGFGESSVDILASVNGLFVAIECKGTGKKPTDRQLKVMRDVISSRGVAFSVPQKANAEHFLGLIKYSFVPPCASSEWTKSWFYSECPKFAEFYTGELINAELQVLLRDIPVAKRN